MRPGAHAILLFLVALAAGCAAAELEPRAPASAVPANAPDALERVALEGAQLVSRDESAVTFLWTGGLEGTVVAPELAARPLDDVVATLEPPVGAFFSLGAKGSAEVGLSILVRDADGVTRCSAAADGRLCILFTRVDDDSALPWTVRLLADDTTAQDAPFELELTVSLVEPTGGGLPALPAASLPPARAFRTPVMVDGVALHEPSIDITPGGAIYVSGYGNVPGALWRSTDGGASFARVPVTDAPYCNNPVDRLLPVVAATGQEGTFHPGCGDIDVAVSGDEHVYFAHHWSGEAVHASHDAGATWTTSLTASSEPKRTDRAWLAADGTSAWLAFNSPRPDVFPGDSIGRTVVSRTTDGGLTWAQVGQTRSWCLPGAFVHSPATGRLLLGTCDEEGVALTTSDDGGVTWDWRPVASRSGEHERLCYTCGIYTVVDADDAGNVYVAWSDPTDNGTFDIWYAASSDEGATWSAPAVVNGAGGTHVMPWITAAEEGHVAVAWYATSFEGDPALANASVWYVHLAETRDALAAVPAWEEQLASPTPVQYGPICLNGSRCGGGRNLGDYLQLAFDPEARPVVAYADGRLGGTWNELSRVMVVTSSGP